MVLWRTTPIFSQMICWTLTVKMIGGCIIRMARYAISIPRMIKLGKTPTNCGMAIWALTGNVVTRWCIFGMTGSATYCPCNTVIECHNIPYLGSMTCGTLARKIVGRNFILMTGLAISCPVPFMVDMKIFPWYGGMARGTISIEMRVRTFLNVA